MRARRRATRIRCPVIGLLSNSSHAPSGRVRAVFGSGAESLGIREDRPRGIRPGVASDAQSNLPARRARGPRPAFPGVLVLDLIYVIAVIAVFVVVGLIAKGVEKL
jgi:hypothetical protein